MHVAPTISSILVGILPVLWLYGRHEVPLRISVGYGVLVWVAAVLLKAAVYRLVVDRMARRATGHRVTALLQGVLSASTELGMAAAFFWLMWQPETLPELMAIGAGAGMAEAVMMPTMRNAFKGTALEAHADALSAGVTGNTRVQWLGVLERVFATMIHMSSRALVYLSIASGAFVPAIIGVCAVACVDGAGFYAHLRRWRFDDVRVLVRLEGFVGTIAAAMTGAFLVLARTLDLFA